MRTGDIVINNSKVNVFITEKTDGVYISLTPDIKDEYETIGWGKTEEEAKQKLKSILERN